MMTPATILLVEDDKAMLAGIPELLQIGSVDYDLDVLTAENGKLGLEVMSTHTPDLIISDINMPQMNGIEFLGHLRQNEKWLHIPIIFLTAKGKEEDIHLAKMNGVDLYITKPFNSAELLELVKSQLDRTFQIQANHQQTITSLKGDILQILNHELNTPLTYVTAYSEMLIDTLEQFNDLSDSYEFLRGIQAGCTRLARLVTDFIQVIELRTGVVEANYRQNLQIIDDIVPILREALYKSKQKNQPHFVQVHFTLPPKKTSPLLGHRESLVSAFDRLFDNAIKFTFSHRGAEGQVDISVHEIESQEIHIRIGDEGVGFPSDVYQKLFELFYQYNRKEFEQQGTGAGLAIARELINLHDGRILVESTPGIGSVFTVTLPLYQPDRQPFTTAVEATRKQATVLVVEDDEHLLSGLQELLDIYEGKYRLNVLTARNGKEGLKILAQRRPHLIISDIMMPQMGGMEFLEQVRKIDQLVQVPFIFLTAKSERRDILAGIILGAEEYITKPYDSDKLLDLVGVQLDKYFQRQGLLSQNFESLKRNIVQLMSPDFRSPLQKVAEHTKQVLDKIEDSCSDDELKNSLQHIQQGSEQLSQLVKYFIALAELTTDEAKTNFHLQADTIPHLGQLIQTAVTLFAYDMPQDGTVIQPTIQKDLLPVTGVERTLSKCIQNTCKLLQINHLETTPKIVHLSAHQVHHEAHIAIWIDHKLPETTLAQIATLLAQERQPRVDLPGHDALWRIIQGHILLHNGRIQIANDPHFMVTLILPSQTSSDENTNI